MHESLGTRLDSDADAAILVTEKEFDDVRNGLRRAHLDAAKIRPLRFGFVHGLS